ncbi:uncharacterized protein LOC142169722 [Nicotiana tabacum]|uniref:Uncharacterized protein LOC142169722 n=1 Tax=Nicotiana tabacum TaxID=4097 RepID=A0AC58SRX6_TOBAC
MTSFNLTFEDQSIIFFLNGLMIMVTGWNIVSTDATYCLPCYLFKGDNIHQGGGDVFSSKGFRNWHKIKDNFSKHIGRSSSVHNQTKRNYEDLIQQQHSIHAVFDKQSDQMKYEYRLRLNSSIYVVRLLLNQGLALRGHDEKVNRH